MDILNTEEYQFLNTINNVAYLTLGGSKAYGTNTPTSDTDIRGFRYETADEVFGLSEYEDTYEHKATDTVIYTFKKFVKLLANCNPNVIEMLGTRDCDVLKMDDTTKYMRENSHMFLSKRAYVTFVGYATSQLRRLENALARDSYTAREKDNHIMKTLQAEFLKYKSDYGDFGKMDLAMNDEGIIVSADFSNMPLKKFIDINAMMNNTLRNYGKLNHRNNKKDEAHLNKHAMHLIRLYYMGIDILKNKEIVTYRENEHDTLMAIRNGEMSMQDVFKLKDSLEKEIKLANETSDLPDKVDYKAINSFVAKVLREHT